MAQRDGKSELQIAHLGIVTLSGTATVASAWVDTKGFDKVTFVPVNTVVTDAGAAAGYSFEVQESDTTAAAAAVAVADAELLGLESALTVTADGDDNTVKGTIGYVGDARYVRMAATGTTGSAAVVAILAVLSNASVSPPDVVGTAVAAT